jgi:streptogramin lyase
LSSIVLHVIRRIPQALMTLAMMGAGLFLWIPSAAAEPTAPAASTITEFHVSNVGVPQGITAGPDGNLWLTEAVGNIGRITTH